MGARRITLVRVRVVLRQAEPARKLRKEQNPDRLKDPRISPKFLRSWLAYHPPRQTCKGDSSMSHPSITIPDVMRLHNVSRSTIYRRINDGTLKAYRFGPRIIRFDAAEVAAAIRK